MKSNSLAAIAALTVGIAVAGESERRAHFQTAASPGSVKANPSKKSKRKSQRAARRRNRCKV